MDVNDAYRLYARDCIALARISHDVQTRAVLLGLAQAWIRLADQFGVGAKPWDDGHQPEDVPGGFDPERGREAPRPEFDPW
jgi:hypothetical protein